MLKDSVKTWEKTKSGRKVTGILCDTTAKIDFIAWNDDVDAVETHLQKDKTYHIEDVKVKECLQRYSKTNKNVQVVFTRNTKITEKIQEPMQCPLNITPVKDLKSHLTDKVNVAGKIVSITNPVTTDGAKLLNVKIRDLHADVEVSFWRQAAQSFSGEVDDILYIEQCPMKLFGSYLVLQASQCHYTLNEKHKDLAFLTHVNTDNDNGIQHLSPKKQPSNNVQSVGNLIQNNSKQSFEAEVSKITVSFYDRCPVKGCNKSLYKNENSGLYVCEKCDRFYLVSAIGVCLKAEVLDNKKNATVTFFNKMAERFVEETVEGLKNMKDDTDSLLDKVRQKMFKFTVSGGRKMDEFNCIDFEFLRSNEDDKDNTSDSIYAKVLKETDEVLDVIELKKTNATECDPHDLLSKPLPNVVQGVSPEVTPPIPFGLGGYHGAIQQYPSYHSPSNTSAIRHTYEPVFGQTTYVPRLPLYTYRYIPFEHEPISSYLPRGQHAPYSVTQKGPTPSKKSRTFMMSDILSEQDS